MNKRGIAILSAVLISSSILTGCSISSVEAKQSSTVKGGYKLIKLIDNRHVIEGEERLSLGTLEDLSTVFNKSDKLLKKDDIYYVHDYSGVKGFDLTIAVQPKTDTIKEIRAFGDFKVWSKESNLAIPKDKSKLMEIRQNFIKDFYRLTGHKMQDILNYYSDCDIAQEISDFTRDFLESETKAKSRVIYLNNKVTFKAIKDGDNVELVLTEKQ